MVKSTKKSILPKLKDNIETKNRHYINQHFIYEYPKINKFCKDYHVSVQAMLSVMIFRAVRKFWNWPNDTIIYNQAPCDTRASKYSSKEFKQRKFFSNSSGIFHCLIGKESVLEEIKFAYDDLKKCLENNDHVICYIKLVLAINPKTLEFIGFKTFPMGGPQNITICSNIGNVSGECPLVGLCFNTQNNFEENYSLNINSLNNGKILTIMCFRPMEFDQKFMNIIIEEMNYIFNLKFI